MLQYKDKVQSLLTQIMLIVSKSHQANLQTFQFSVCVALNISNLKTIISTIKTMKKRFNTPLLSINIKQHTEKEIYEILVTLTL